MTEPIKPLSALIEEARNQMVVTRRLLQEISLARSGWKECIDPTAGLLTCGIIALHVAQEEVIRHEIKVADNERGQSFMFAPRGIGVDICPGCFVCGTAKRNPEANDYLNNIAAFVASNAEGETIVSWFERGARLDYRDFEPHRIQLKVGACDAHLPQLQALYETTSAYGVIRQRDIADVLTAHLTTKEA